MGVVAGAAVMMLTSMGQAYLEWDSKDAALDAQERALKNMQYLDLKKIDDIASKFDLKKYKTQLAAQKLIDPSYAALRDQGAQGILTALQKDAAGDGYAETSLTRMADELDKNSPAFQSVISGLLEKAKEDLANGAKLPPEFQAELVRSGLERAGTSGMNLDGRGASGVASRELLGNAGINLRAQRIAQAQSAAGAAGSLQDQRSGILSTLATLDNNLRGAKVQRAAGAAQLGQSSLPSIGITGGQAAGMDISNTNLKNQVTIGLGNIKAAKRLAEGEMYSKMLGSGGSFVGGLMGGGGGGGGGGGMMGMFGGGGGGGDKGGSNPMQSMSFNSFNPGLGSTPQGYGGSGYQQGYGAVGSWIGGLFGNPHGGSNAGFSTTPTYLGNNRMYYSDGMINGAPASVPLWQ